MEQISEELRSLDEMLAVKEGSDRKAEEPVEETSKESTATPDTEGAINNFP